MNIKDYVHKRTVELRAILRLVETEKFQRVWARTKDLDKANFIVNVNNGKRDDCFKWYDAQIRFELESMRLQDLRILAKQRGIEKYHHLDRASLLTELKRNA